MRCAPGSGLLVLRFGFGLPGGWLSPASACPRAPGLRRVRPSPGCAVRAAGARRFRAAALGLPVRARRFYPLPRSLRSPPPPRFPGRGLFASLVRCSFLVAAGRLDNRLRRTRRRGRAPVLGGKKIAAHQSKNWAKKAPEIGGFSYLDNIGGNFQQNPAQLSTRIIRNFGKKTRIHLVNHQFWCYYQSGSNDK